MSAKVTSSTARKVIGSLGVIGAAAAVAGMGTFGSFTDSTAPVNTTINSGTVSIDLTNASTLEFAAADLIPGDSVTRTYTLKNDGSNDLGSIMLASAATTTSVLTTDATNGLQATLDVTLPGRTRPRGRLHPATQILRQVTRDEAPLLGAASRARPTTRRHGCPPPRPWTPDRRRRRSASWTSPSHRAGRTARRSIT